MKRRFNDHSLQKIYDWYRLMKPDPETHRHKGACGNAYFVGRTHPEIKRPFAQEGSMAYAAWAAGVDNANSAKRDR